MTVININVIRTRHRTCDALVSKAKAQVALRAYHGGNTGPLDELARYLMLNQRDALKYLLQAAQGTDDATDQSAGQSALSSLIERLGKIGQKPSPAPVRRQQASSSASRLPPPVDFVPGGGNKPSLFTKIFGGDAARMFPSYTTSELKGWLDNPGVPDATKEKASTEIAARESGASVQKVPPQIEGGKVVTKIGRL